MEHLHLSSPPGDGAGGDHHHGHHGDGKDHDPHHHGDYLSSQSLACVCFILFTIQLSLIMVQVNLVIMKLMVKILAECYFHLFHFLCQEKQNLVSVSCGSSL